MVVYARKNKIWRKYITFFDFFRYKIADNTSLSGVSKKRFLSDVETKKDLTIYLAEQSVRRLENIGMKYAVTYETTCLANLENFPEELRRHDHEEAYTLILLHAVFFKKSIFRITYLLTWYRRIFIDNLQVSTTMYKYSVPDWSRRQSEKYPYQVWTISLNKII